MGLYFSICSFIISIILMIIYFGKKKINNNETKIYGVLLVSTLFMLLLEVITGFLYEWGIETGNIYYKLLCKMIFVSYISINTLFSKYLINICNEKKEKNKIFLFLFVITILFVLLAPLQYFETENSVQPSGISVVITFIYCIVFMFYQIFLCIKNRKRISNLKFTPYYIFLLLGVVNFIILIFFPGSFLIGFIFFISVLIMYFTIENPDMKMLDEVHKAKKITDGVNEEKAMFLYNMTNEIKGISRDIEHNADAILLETDEKDIDIENINDRARDIKAGTARFNTMTNEILDISSLDSASIKIYNDKYNIKLIIRELVQIYKAKAEEKGLEFRTSIASDLPEYLYGDAVNVKILLNTILDNSVKYTESGYIEFSADSIKKNDIARLIISIEDSGVGMKAEELNKIFNKRVEEKEGTNLKKSLYNAKKLVTLMGGTIIPSSIYGRGTNIKVVLDQKIVEEKTSLNKYESVLDKKKILLVDDNEASVKMITKLLKDSNIKLESVSTGKECLDKIREKEKYDLILLDEHMSPLDGITVMRKLKMVRSFNTNVILLTRNNEYEYSNEHISYGFSDYLLKPIDKDKLLEKIGKYSK